MASNAQKESEERIKVFEEHFFKGVNEGIAATKNQLTIPELIDVTSRCIYQFNKRNLNFTRGEVHKDAVEMQNKVRKLGKNQGK